MNFYKNKKIEKEDLKVEFNKNPNSILHSIYLYEYHKVRLENTARQWGIQFSKDKFNNIISEIMNKLDEQMKRVKLSLHGTGEFTYEIFPFQLAENTIQEVILAPTPISSLDPFLRYKTSERSLYNKYRKLLKPNQEIILHNEFGEITEGSISNIILDIDGNLCTPTVDSGLLAGTYRQWMIDQGKLIERKLYLNDLYSAAKIYLCNGLRGMWEVSLKEEQRK